MKLVVISGRSGSGKSTALSVLEDVGYNCIDNLPVSLLPARLRAGTASGCSAAGSVLLIGTLTAKTVPTPTQLRTVIG